MLETGDADIATVQVADRGQADGLVGEVCKFDLASNSYPETCEVTDDAKPLRLYIGRPGISQDVLLMNWAIATSEESPNPYLGSGQLDGNGIPADFFADEHIRKAFAYCFDFNTLIEDVLRGEALQPVGLPLPGMPGYDPETPHYTTDLDKCAEEFKLADLDKDGIPAGDDPEGDVWTTGFRVQMAYNQGKNTRQTIAEILAGNLAEVTLWLYSNPIRLQSFWLRGSLSPLGGFPPLGGFAPQWGAFDGRGDRLPSADRLASDDQAQVGLLRGQRGCLCRLRGDE